jgi:hypothetical protein
MQCIEISGESYLTLGIKRGNLKKGGGERTRRQLEKKIKKFDKRTYCYFK